MTPGYSEARRPWPEFPAIIYPLGVQAKQLGRELTVTQVYVVRDESRRHGPGAGAELGPAGASGSTCTFACLCLQLASVRLACAWRRRIREMLHTLFLIREHGDQAARGGPWCDARMRGFEDGHPYFVDGWEDGCRASFRALNRVTAEGLTGLEDGPLPEKVVRVCTGLYNKFKCIQEHLDRERPS